MFHENHPSPWVVFLLGLITWTAAGQKFLVESAACILCIPFERTDNIVYLAKFQVYMAMTRLLLVVLFVLNTFPTFAQIPAPREANKTIVCRPADLQYIHTTDAVLNTDIAVFNQMLQASGLSPLTNKASNANVVNLRIDPNLKDEEYNLEVKAGSQVELRGGKHGVFHGLMTLLQYMQLGKEDKALVLPGLHDYPGFEWRGMHLDVSRHFFPKEFIKKYIDLLALHHLNTFHWHLTDDQGWRIEIRKYPLLTQIGSKRKESLLGKFFTPYKGDGKPVEGFYTQNEIREIVQYAQQRHVTVVPEIEMPGHAMAALSAYPMYSCRKTKLEVMTTWGVSDDVFCTDESTFKFLQDILDEVMNLFPSKYIHIGGDEVPKTRWKECAVCQKTMRSNSLKDEHELQSYFIKRIDQYVTSKGRSIIGWDEILEGGLAPNAAVMSWRGVDGGIAAARQKHRVVMSPGTHCYFDHYQGNRFSEPLAIGGYTPLEKVYAYEPVPESLTPEESTYIMGAQANVWTEYIPTAAQVEYMALPRMCALSEVLWSGKNRPGITDFSARLKKHFALLDTLKVNYAKSVFDVTSSSRVNGRQLEITLKSLYHDGSIRYSFADEDPYPRIEEYREGHPIMLDRSRVMRAQYFEGDKARGHQLLEEYFVHKALGHPPVSTVAPSPSYREGGLPKLVDGKVGREPRLSSDWLGWSGEDPEFVIDLGSVQDVNKLDMYCLKEEANWIYLPVQIEVSTSKDGAQYQKQQTLTKEGIENGYLMERKIAYPLNGIPARFVKIKFKCAPLIAAGKPGAGEKAWLFLSELLID